MTAAFCPGHITALFYAPPPGPTFEATGSLGAGLCIALGARARVSVSRSRGWEVLPGPGTRLAPVVAIALGNYISGLTRPARLQLDLELDLPVGQGFGMSGAMTLAALLAAERRLRLLDGDRDRLVAIAHAAEVEAGTGLGDVVPQAQGGMDLRIAPGAPPHGEVLKREADAEVLVAWSNEPLHTRGVLSDPGTKERLEAVCVPLLERADPDGGLGWLLEAGSAFTRDIGLASEDVVRMMEACSPHGKVSQVMLGNSVFALGDLKPMGAALDGLSYSWTTTRVDNVGARLLR